MSLSEKITVNTHYTRSVNLERDANSSNVVRSYIPTTRAVQTLPRIMDTLKRPEAPRAWSLVGPYGSGKSSFAAFLTYLLASPGTEQAQAARRVLKDIQPNLYDEFVSLQRDTDGYCVVLLTGSPEPLSRRLVQALANAAGAFWANRTGRKPDVIRELQRFAVQEHIQVSELLNAIVKLQDALSRSGGSGLLIVVDELGKFLEYEARHYGANDIYLLQALAEHACAAHSVKLTLLVLLHQAMDQYAKGLGETMRNEWTKVQGRFETVPFIESSKQVLRIVAAAISHDLSEDEQALIKRQTLDIVEQLHQAGALPKAHEPVDAAELFACCYPLHPLSAMLLPTLCQKVAQNERTLFSYLGSHEPHGFSDSVQRLSAVGKWILPWEIYEYFILNQTAAVTDHHTRRRWAEVVTAVERLGDAPEREVQLLQSIGLLNILGPQGGFKASKEVIHHFVTKPAKPPTVIRSLLKKSVLQYRKFSGEYRVWEGSDFDLDDAVQAQVERLGRFNLAEQLNRRHDLEPIVARRHTIEMGTLRFFIPVFSDASSFRKLPQSVKDARIIFFLADGQGDRGLFSEEVCSYFSEQDIAVECLNTDRLRESVADVLALEAVRREAQELNTDPVAQREFKDRYVAALGKERELLAALTENPHVGAWYREGKRLEVKSRRDLQVVLSEALDSVYSECPVIKNELINRDKPSSQAAAARNKLLAAMLHHESEPELAIEKYPPEKAIYQALLRETGIHQEVDGNWQFCSPKARDKYNMSPVWERIESFFEETEQAPKPLTELDSVLQAPPFGVKAGVLPILYIAAYLTKQDEIALFEEGRYVPYLTDDQLERFVRRPGDFAVQSFKLEGLRASIFKEYTQLLYGDAEDSYSVLSIARPLAKFMGELPDYARTTKRVSKTAQGVRSAFALAKSPQTLLFEQLPDACGLDELSAAEPDGKALNIFSERLKNALRELKLAYPNLLDAMRKLLAQAFNLDRHISLDDLRGVLRGRVEGLDAYTVDVDGLRAFVRRVAKPTGTDEEWFANILLFLGQKPSRKWSDTDAEGAEFRLSEFSRRLNDLEKLRIHYEGEKRKRGTDFDVLLLRTVRRGARERDEIVCIDDKTRAGIKTIKAEFAERLAGLGDRELRLAVLAELVDEILASQERNIRVAMGTEDDPQQELALGGHHG